MLRLLLIRHAKAVPADPAADDFGRPLAARGRRDATRLGEYLAEQHVQPDVVLCSAARRTRETLAGLLSGIAEDCKISLLGGLYGAEWPDYLATLAKVESAATVALIGHNPTVHELALTLAGDIAADSTAVRQRFPTGAMAIIAFPFADWRDLTAGTGHLTAFVQPRDLHAGRSRSAGG